MSADTKTSSRSALLKSLRETHLEGVARAQGLLKEQNQMREKFLALLKETTRTVPELALESGIAAEKVLWYLSSMKKYCEVIEAGMDGDYPTYKLSEEE